jgi:hypothetical protein
MNKFTKDDLLKFNRKQNFPNDLIEQNSLIYKEILYDQRFENTMNESNEGGLSHSYYVEENPQKVTMKRQWRDNNAMTGNNNYNNIKSNKPVRNYNNVNTAKLEMSNQNFSINNKAGNANNNSSTIFKPGVISEIESFGKIETNTPFNIKSLYLINEKLKTNKNEPLWYLSLKSRTVYGPISSKELEEMYLDRKIDGSQEIRFIDVFKIKGKRNFEFFKLKDLENSNFIKEIDASSVVSLINDLEKAKNELARQEQVKTAEVKKKAELRPPVVEEVKTGGAKGKKVQPAKPKIEIPINTGPSVIDMEYEEGEKELKEVQHVKKGGNAISKKKKGKPMDLDIKTGFYTITEQERNYEPMFIVGDIDK